MSYVKPSVPLTANQKPRRSSILASALVVLLSVHAGAPAHARDVDETPVQEASASVDADAEASLARKTAEQSVIWAMSSFADARALAREKQGSLADDDAKLRKAAAWSNWSWPWQRWFAGDLSMQQAEVLLNDGKVVAIERGSSSYETFLMTGDGNVHYYSSPNQAAFEKLNAAQVRQSIPMRMPPSSALIAFFLIILNAVALYASLYGCYKAVMALTARRRARKSLSSSRRNALTFKDVAGQEGAKEALQDVVAFLRDPDAFKATGARMPAGILLEGEPGNGKTLLARAIAGEAGVPFYAASGSEFIEMFVGTGAARVRGLFRMARKHRVSIVFIDEFDVIASKRVQGRSGDGGASETHQTINELLNQLDGFDRRNRVFFIGATNMSEGLDPAVTRSGRLDRKIFVPNPILADREAILRLHAKTVSLDEDVLLGEVARATPGFSGADLATLLNEGAMMASREKCAKVSMRHLQAVTSTVILGAKRTGAVMTPDERRMVAYHEAGHALVGTLDPDADPVRFATILPRGRSLGAVVQSPDTDRQLMSRKSYFSRMNVAMAGRAAEELVVAHPDDVTGGASADIKYATALASEMAGSMGLCPSVGEVYVRDGGSYNPFAQARLDRAVRDEIRQAKERASHIIRSNMDALHALAGRFLEMESLSGDDVRLTLHAAHAVMPTMSAPSTPRS